MKMNAKWALLIVITLLFLAQVACSGCGTSECWGDACAQCSTGGL